MSSIIQSGSNHFSNGEDKNSIIIESFINHDKAIIHHKNLPNISLLLPLNHQLYLNVNNIEEELNRLTSIYEYFTEGKKCTSKRLIIYNNKNSLLVGLIDYIISKNKYSSYHIFCDDNESYNAFKYLEKKYLNKVRLNDVESNFFSMIRIQFNEYEEYYNDEERCNDDIIFFLNNESNVDYLDYIFKSIHNCYISLPYNKFVILLLNLTYGQYYNIEVKNIKNNYALIKISYNSKKCFTLAPIINKIENFYDITIKNIKHFIKLINDSLE